MQKRWPTCRTGCPRCKNFAADVCGWLSEMRPPFCISGSQPCMSANQFPVIRLLKRGSFRKLGVPYIGVLIIGYYIIRLLGSPIFGNSHDEVTIGWLGGWYVNYFFVGFEMLLVQRIEGLMFAVYWYSAPNGLYSVIDTAAWVDTAMDGSYWLFFSLPQKRLFACQENCLVRAFS